jgi:vacuolar iron transporter family protein
LGISDTLSARQLRAALDSAATFAVGAALPLLLVPLVPVADLVWTVSGSSLFFLALLGFMAARAGDLLGAMAMALTAGPSRRWLPGAVSGCALVKLIAADICAMARP